MAPTQPYTLAWTTSGMAVIDIRKLQSRQGSASTEMNFRVKAARITQMARLVLFDFPTQESQLFSLSARRFGRRMTRAGDRRSG